MHSQWKLGHVTWEIQGYGLGVFRGGIRRTKAQMDWDLAGDVKSNEKGLHKYVCQKRNDKESEPPRQTRRENW